MFSIGGGAGRSGGGASTGLAVFQIVLGVVTVYFVYVLVWIVQLPSDYDRSAAGGGDPAATAFGQLWDAGNRDARRRSLLRVYSEPRSSDDAYNLNETLGQGTSLDRRAPDLRPAECRELPPYDDASLQSNVSVVISFHNEAVSFVLRTVHSILNYTPAQLLADVILVDDGSSNANLMEQLDDYVRLLPSKVRLLRLAQREGLVRARMAGYRYARGSAVAFMDAHVEVSERWLEPLLDYVRRHPSTIVQPIIHAIDPSTLTWPDPTAVDQTELYRGVFRWDMRYAWQKVPKQYLQWRPSPATPFPNPILVGCTTVVDRKYFDSIRGFDAGLNIWGGDNIELSLRSWLCGGGVATHPCSSVAHVFKPFSFSFGGEKEKIIAKNNIRVIETWLPTMRDYYYASSFVYAYKRVEYTDAERASLAAYRDGLKELHCRNFSWFQANVLPEMHAPEKDMLFFGEVQNLHSKSCFFVHADGYVGLTSDCSPATVHRPEAEFGITASGHMMHHGGLCVHVTDMLLLTLASCVAVQPQQSLLKIELEKNPAIGESSGQITCRYRGRKHCLQHVTNVADPHRKEQMPQFFPECDESNPWQQWIMTYHFGWALVPAPDHFR